MDRVFVLLKRKKGLTFEQFREHYENSHRRLGEKYFGHLFKSYHRNYVRTGDRWTDGKAVENAYDCLTELVFHDEGGYAELVRIATNPEVQRILAEDEERFCDRAACSNAISDLVTSDCSKFKKA